MSNLSPADAEVALRTFPRRWRELLDGLDPADPDDAARLAGTGRDGRTPTASAVAAAAVLEAAAAHLGAALAEDRPTLTGAGPEPVAPAPAPAAALGRLDVAAPALADAVAAVSATDLDRTAQLDGRDVTVRQLVADAVTRAGDLLRDAESALRAG